MRYGQSAEAFTRKIIRSRDYLRALRLPHQARRMLSYAGLAGPHNPCYAFNRWRNSLPVLETKERFQLVREEAGYGQADN